MNNMNGVLIVSHLRVQNANAISGPLTWGFPAVHAFTGFAHALGRHISDLYPAIFGGVGIVCHGFEPQLTGKHTKVFNLARHPVDKDGNTSAFVEEGRVHLEISLVIAANADLEPHKIKAFETAMLERIYTMRIAGGSVLPYANRKSAVQWHELPSAEEDLRTAFKKIRRRLLPGFALVSRQDLLEKHYAELKNTMVTASPLDALLDLTRLNLVQQIDPTNPEKAIWEYRQKSGWLVPIPVGYGAISQLYAAGEVANTRDEQVPVRFVESLYSLGQWISPHRIDSFSQLFWQHQAQPEEGLYLCVNNFEPHSIRS